MSNIFWMICVGKRTVETTWKCTNQGGSHDDTFRVVDNDKDERGTFCGKGYGYGFGINRRYRRSRTTMSVPSFPPVPPTSTDEWYVRVNSKRVFGPFSRVRLDTFLRARRSRTGTTTEIRRNASDPWHVCDHTADSPRVHSKRGSAYDLWKPKTGNQNDTIKAITAADAARHLKEVLESHNDPIAQKNRRDREIRNEEAMRRRAGADFLAKLYDVPAIDILPKGASQRNLRQGDGDS